MVSASINPLPSDRLRCCDWYIRGQRSLAVKPLNSRPAMQTVRPIGRRWRRCEIQPASQPAHCHWQWAGISLPMYDIGLQLLGVRVDSHVQHYTDWRHKPQSRAAQLWLVLFRTYWVYRRCFGVIIPVLLLLLLSQYISIMNDDDDDDDITTVTKSIINSPRLTYGE